MSERGFLWKWLLVALGLHGLAVYFSVGHQSVDEHFQILEFAGYKLGLTPAQDMPVELGAMIRPWLQPAIVVAIVRAARALGIENPFQWAFAARALSALLGWLSLVALGVNAGRWFPQERARRLFIRALALLWFLPALHARTSSENWGGSTFLIALGLACASLHPLASLAAGFLAGLSFEFRYQMGFMIAGLFAWLVYRAFGPVRPPGARRAPLLYAAGLLPALLLGGAADYWGYGRPVFAAWNYFNYNLVQGVADTFGSAPWWRVIEMSYTDTWPLLGSLTLLSWFVAWIRNPRHPLTWAQVPFLVAHAWIGHKELRFFYPIAAATPAYLALALAPLRRTRGGRLPGGLARAARPALAGLEVYQLLALAVLTLTPASRKVAFEALVQAKVPPGTERFELFYEGLDPYEQYGTPIHFYRPPALILRPRTERQKSDPRRASEPYWLSSTRDALPPDCELEGASLPRWLTSAATPWPAALRRRIDRLQRWSLYRCQG